MLDWRSPVILIPKHAHGSITMFPSGFIPRRRNRHRSCNASTMSLPAGQWARQVFHRQGNNKSWKTLPDGAIVLSFV